MTPRLKLRKPGSPALVAALTLSIGAYSLSTAALAADALAADLAEEHTVLNRCRENADSCPSNAAQFLRLVSAVTSKSGRAQLDEVNQGVSAAIRYVSDYAQFGEADRWSAPLASFATAKGDCEDYAIAKYVALQEAGFPRDELRLVLVRDRSVRQDHAVLAAH